MFVNARAIIEREISAGIEIVVQTRSKPHERKTTELPGGRVEEFESLVSALKREVQEETGLTLTHIEGVDTRVVDTHDAQCIPSIFKDKRDLSSTVSCF